MRQMTYPNWKWAIAGFALLLVAGTAPRSAAAYAVYPPPDRPAVSEDDDDRPPPGDGPDGPRARHRRPGPGGDARDGFGPGRRGPDGPRGLGPRGDKYDDPEMIDRVMDTLKEKLPETHDRLSRLRDERPVLFNRVIHRIMPIIGEYQDIKKRNPQLAETIIEEFKIEEQLRDLTRQYHDADAAKKSTLEDQIKPLVRRQIELRDQRNEARLAEFADRIKKQSQRLDEERQRFENEKAKMDDRVARRLEDVKSGRREDGFRGPRPHGSPPGERNEGDRRRGPDDGPPGEREDRPPPPDDGGE